ncbi:hypothetical protein [Chryseobacterium tongliaoense]|uniref:hypothetical protein n=1 Tax=Chryseobacterium tongliaoense TaxID=3240933 RepID=UPI003516201E
MVSVEEIYTHLSDLQNLENWDSGLNGRSAAALFFFHYNKSKKDLVAYNKGVELLEYELNNLELVFNPGLFNGICGIAWVVNHLSAEKMAEIDHDIFLPELLEQQLKDLFFSTEILISVEQFIINTDILFYFIERFTTTESDVLKKEYSIFINHSLILFTHYFYQLDSNKLYENLSSKSLMSFIKTLNLLIEIFPSPLLNFLLSKSIHWILLSVNLEHNPVNLNHLLKSLLYLNDNKLYKKVRILVPKKTKLNTKDINDLKKINLSKNIGIWNIGYARAGLQLIIEKDNIQKKPFKYLFELD